MLQRPRLKQQVWNALELEESNLGDEYLKFMELCSKKAVVFEKDPFWEYLAKNNSEGNTCRKTNLDNHGSKIHGSGSSSENNDKTAFSDGSKRTLPECLNFECDKRHLVKNCPNPSAKLGEKLLEGTRKIKSGSKPPKVFVVVCENAETSMASQVLSDASASNSNNFAAIDAEIGGHKLACCSDSGANIVEISEPTVNFLGDKGVYLPTSRPSNTEQV